uniref:Uncharacterized protein n=1 Tax=Aegilops tauschii subsp. strangulata TaxID=200361 RepID=A0A453AA60_AEGTS
RTHQLEDTLYRSTRAAKPITLTLTPPTIHDHHVHTPLTMSTASSESSPAAYDRTAELHALDTTYAGVRGLVASGVTHVPRIFRVPDQHHEP